MAAQVEGDSNVLQVQGVRVVGPCPPNSVSLSLDGTEKQVRLNYIRCQEDFRSWNIELAIVRGNNVNSTLLDLDGTEKQVFPRFIHCHTDHLYWNIKNTTDEVEILLATDNVIKVFTTPSRSTFYYCMIYQGRYLVFVIEGKTGWLHGYYGVNGMYGFESAEPYITDERCRPLPFGGNHHEICPGGVGNTSIGLGALREAFDAIWGYNGVPKQAHPNFRKSFGVIVVHICESMKLRHVFKRVCKAFTDPSVDKLGKEYSLLITSWSYLSGQAMQAIDDTDYQIHTRNVPHISSKEDILTHLALLYVDSYFLGIFKHEATNIRHWEPLERGNGVPSFDDILCLEKRIDDDDRESDEDQQDGQSGGKQKREGDEKRRHHGKSNGNRGGGNRGKGQQEGGGGGGGGGRQRGGVSLSAAGFPLIGGWSGGQGKDLSIDQNPIGWVMQPKDLVCMYMRMCKPPAMCIMEESKYPWCQLIKNCSLTSLSFYTTNLQQQDLGTVVMTRGGDRLSWTEALKWIGTALLGLEEWYLIGWG